MMALYQQAMYLLPGDQNPTVDGRFGKETHESLKTVQKDIFKFTGTDVDGLPGPKTTAALIEALDAKVALPPLTAKPLTAPATAPSHEQRPASLVLRELPQWRAHRVLCGAQHDPWKAVRVREGRRELT